MSRHRCPRYWCDACHVRRAKCAKHRNRRWYCAVCVHQERAERHKAVRRAWSGRIVA